MKMFLRIFTPLGIGLGLFGTYRWNITIGGLCVLGSLIFSCFVVLLVRSSFERRRLLIEGGKFKPDYRFAKRFLFVTSSVVLLSIPILFIYTPLQKWVVPGNVLWVILLLELVFLYTFVSSFREIRKTLSTGDTIERRKELLRFPPMTTTVVIASIIGIGVVVSKFNKDISAIFMIGSLVVYWVYHDLFRSKRGVTQNKTNEGSSPDKGQINSTVEL